MLLVQANAEYLVRSQRLEATPPLGFVLCLIMYEVDMTCMKMTIAQRENSISPILFTHRYQIYFET